PPSRGRTPPRTPGGSRSRGRRGRGRSCPPSSCAGDIEVDPDAVAQPEILELVPVGVTDAHGGGGHPADHARLAPLGAEERQRGRRGRAFAYRGPAGAGRGAPSA